VKEKRNEGVLDDDTNNIIPVDYEGASTSNIPKYEMRLTSRALWSVLWCDAERTCETLQR
jgi:hypothetical protein